MESKRKVNGGAAASAEDVNDRSAKRRKLPEGEETIETTTIQGLAFVEQLKRTTDKSGRLVATNFLTLPSRTELPDYYEFIKMPIAIDTIESKLKRGEFPTLTALESYIKRMVSNAKEYNEQGSEIHADAERIRKALSNFMVKHNPAYKTPGYIAVPTPLPPDKPERQSSSADIGSDVDAEGDVDMDSSSTSTHMAIKRRPGRPPKNPLHPAHPSQLLLAAQRTSSVGQTEPPQKLSGNPFTGMTFQQAQDKLVSDMIAHKENEEDEFPTFEPFVNLPPRTLKDYYQVIPHPVSLKGLQKRVRGVHGRNEMTGVSDFRDWKSLEEEVERIWLNAWHYNEDGSEISLLAKKLQTSFRKNLAEAKKAVAEPQQPKLKLKMSAPETAPKITLRMGGRASSTESPAPSVNTNGSAGLPLGDAQNNGTGTRRNLVGSSGTLPNVAALDRGRSISVSVNSPSPGPGLIKNEESAKPAPILPPIKAPYKPHALSLPQSQPQRSTPTSHSTGAPILPPNITNAMNSPYYAGATGQTNPYGNQSPFHTPTSGFESKWRQSGKDASDAMITNLSLATHPGLNISRHFRLDLPPSPTLAQQSITLNLPSTHYYLQIKPTIAAPLLDRQHKLFVTSGTQRLHGMPTIPGQAVDPRQPLFEARLLPGVNRIEVELIAALPKGAAKAGNGQDVELEKITVFANLLKR